MSIRLCVIFQPRRLQNNDAGDPPAEICGGARVFRSFPDILIESRGCRSPESGQGFEQIPLPQPPWAGYFSPPCPVYRGFAYPELKMSCEFHSTQIKPWCEMWAAKEPGSFFGSTTCHQKGSTWRELWVETSGPASWTHCSAS